MNYTSLTVWATLSLPSPCSVCGHTAATLLLMVVYAGSVSTHTQPSQVKAASVRFQNKGLLSADTRGRVLYILH